MSFFGSNSDLYPASVTAVICAIMLDHVMASLYCIGSAFCSIHINHHCCKTLVYATFQWEFLFWHFVIGHVTLQPSLGLLSWCPVIKSNLCNLFNPSWPSDVIWRQGTGSTLAQEMACCLTAPSHYLNQCWPIINESHWYPSENNFTTSKWVAVTGR